MAPRCSSSGPNLRLAARFVIANGNEQSKGKKEEKAPRQKEDDDFSRSGRKLKLLSPLGGDEDMLHSDFQVSRSIGY